MEEAERSVVYFNKYCVSVCCVCRGDLGHTYKLLCVSAVTNPLQQTGQPAGEGKQGEIYLKKNYGTFAYCKDGIIGTGFTFPPKQLKINKISETKIYERLTIKQQRTAIPTEGKQIKRD